MGTKQGLRLLVILLVCIGAGCALGDLEPAAPQGPMIIIPTSPATVFEGSCENTQMLDQWLQPTVTHAFPEFQASLNRVISLENAVLRQELVALTQLRQQFAQNPVPDCAIEAHNFFMEMINRLIDEIYVWVNGGDSDLHRTLVDLVGNTDQMQTHLDDLMDLLEAQYRE